MGGGADFSAQEEYDMFKYFEYFKRIHPSLYITECPMKTIIRETQVYNEEIPEETHKMLKQKYKKYEEEILIQEEEYNKIIKNIKSVFEENINDMRNKYAEKLLNIIQN